jgi:hypothetical protein
MRRSGLSHTTRSSHGHQVLFSSRFNSAKEQRSQTHLQFVITGERTKHNTSLQTKNWEKKKVPKKKKLDLGLWMDEQALLINHSASHDSSANDLQVNEVYLCLLDWFFCFFLFVFCSIGFPRAYFRDLGAAR